jgi:hypothetical protein
MQYPIWQRAYGEAMQETDPDRLVRLVRTAEEAIMHRLQDLALTPGGEEEKRAIQLACEDLLGVKTGRLGWPALESELG